MWPYARLCWVNNHKTHVTYTIILFSTFNCKFKELKKKNSIILKYSWSILFLWVVPWSQGQCYPFFFFLSHSQFFYDIFMSLNWLARYFFNVLLLVMHEWFLCSGDFLHFCYSYQRPFLSKTNNFFIVSLVVATF